MVPGSPAEFVWIPRIPRLPWNSMNSLEPPAVSAAVLTAARLLAFALKIFCALVH